MSTRGPGATNMVNGVAHAFLDRAPLIAITDAYSRPTYEIGLRQRLNQLAIYEPIVKWSTTIDAKTVRQQVRRAMRTATAEPPGPVHLDLPEDVAIAPAEAAVILSEAKDLPVAAAAEGPSSRGLRMTAESDLERVIELLRKARKPVAALGFSLYRSGALQELRTFVAANHLPFVTTNMAKGVIPEYDPLWLGVIGRVRRKTIEDYLAQADLVLGIGYDPVEISYEEWMPHIPLVHVDAEPADVDGSVRLEHEAIGNLGDALRRLAAMPPTSNDWDDADMGRFRQHLEASIRLPGDGFQPWQALDVMRELLPHDAILTCDVGAHTHLVATQWRVTVPETLLVSNGWSSMGYAIPAALGAKLAAPDRTVAAVMGDGCFLMMAGEMATAARLGLPIPFVVLNDSWLSLIKVKQERKDYAYSGVEVASTPSRPPAEYFGVPNLVARTPEEFRQALGQALRMDGPCVVEAMVRPEIYSTILYG